MPNPQRLFILTTLREQAGLSLSEMALRLGLRGSQSRKTVSAWERGEMIPRENRRAKFIGYLWDDLRLRNAPEQFARVWGVLAEEWGWEPIDQKEWHQFTPVPLADSGSAPVRPTLTVARFSPARFKHLPSPLTPLIGREREVANLCTSLLRNQIRLLTITGPPGIGKSRLCLQVTEVLR